MKKFCIFMFCVFAFSVNVFAEDSALVLSVTQGVAYSLGSKSEPLAVKMDVPIAAVLKSDATGKAQLIFPDDSTLTIAPDTTITLSEYTDIEEEENILLDLVSGTVRIITGETNRKNPQAFTVNTPQASIGIRGTLVTIQVSGDLTRVYLTETSGKGVSVRNLHTGKVMELRKPGRIINVGPNFMDERKAQKEEAASFNAALRGKSLNGQRRAKAIADAERLKKASATLATEGTLPPATLANPVQMAAMSNADMLNHVTLVADNMPAVPVKPGLPQTPAETPAVEPVVTPTVPDVPTTPEVPEIPDPVITPEPNVSNYMLELAGTWAMSKEVEWTYRYDALTISEKFTSPTTISFSIPSSYSLDSEILCGQAQFVTKLKDTTYDPVISETTMMISQDGAFKSVGKTLDWDYGKVDNGWMLDDPDNTAARSGQLGMTGKFNSSSQADVNVEIAIGGKTDTWSEYKTSFSGTLKK